MEKMRIKLKRVLNLMWSMPLLVVLLAAGVLLSWTVEGRLLKSDATPRNGEDEKEERSNEDSD